MPNIPLAKKLIEQAADLCVSSNLVADKHAEYVSKRDGSIKPVSNPITTGTDTFLDELRKEINSGLKKSDEDAAKHDYANANLGLDDVLAKSLKATELKKADTEYNVLLKKVNDDIAALTTSTPPENDPIIGSDIVGLQQKIVNVGSEATKLDYPAAMKLLNETATLVKSAALKKKMKGNVKPTEAELTELIKQPGGIKLLDQIVATLGSAAQQGVVLIAMKVRFGLDAAVSIAHAQKTDADTVESDTVVDANLSLQKIYELMTKVPDKHTKENPSFKKIKRYAGDPLGTDSKAGSKGDYYEPTGKELVLSVGAPGAYEYPLQNADQLPDIDDDDCKPVDSVAPKFFDNNTLHEVAHAIDDKKRFMKRNGGSAEYGGWIEHGADVMPAALAAAKALSYDAGYIAKYLLKEPGLVAPLPPSGTTPVAWNAAQVKAKKWADAIRVGKNPWNEGTLCKTDITADGIVIDGRIYHEAYAGIWVSYLAEKRKQGVTGYQFRAPGEWFAELYAVYGNRKLKKDHPAVKLFLGKMFPLPTA